MKKWSKNGGGTRFYTHDLDIFSSEPGLWSLRTFLSIVSRRAFLQADQNQE